MTAVAPTSPISSRTASVSYARSPVADRRLVPPKAGEKRLGLRAVGRLARGQEHCLHHLVAVETEMDLGRPSAAAGPTCGGATSRGAPAPCL